MALTIDEERYQKIRAKVELHRAQAEVTEVDWDRQPAFTNVDEFLAYLEKKPEPEDYAPRVRLRRR